MKKDSRAVLIINNADGLKETDVKKLEPSGASLKGGVRVSLQFMNGDSLIHKCGRNTCFGGAEQSEDLILKTGNGEKEAKGGLRSGIPRGHWLIRGEPFGKKEE